MEKLCKQHKSYLDLLNTSDPKFRKVMLDNASPKQRRMLIEIIANTLNGNIPLSAKQKSALQKHKCKLRSICKTCINKKNKIININSKSVKKNINQIGGILPFFIAPLLALAAKAAVGGVVSAGAGYATKKIIDSATK